MTDPIETDDHLGAGYTSREITLKRNLVATLVRHRAETNTRGAVLHLHGWLDYFFQTHVAEHFAGLGYDFYALDLRHYGRSLRGTAQPFFTNDLREYYEELDAAFRLITDADGHQRLVVLGHSTGGLLGPLWLADRRATVTPEALILNSPWLDLQENWLMRTAGTWAIRGASRAVPKVVLPHSISPAYGESLHADYRGEWTYNLEWKPKTAPVHMAWIAAVRRAQARVHRGLKLELPILMLHSDHSRLGMKKWAPEAMTTDTVLDVEQMVQWAPTLGSDVTTVMIAGALHDVFLSAPPVRGRAFDRMDDWLLGKVT